ncbi:MAG: tetratricopeptide repeat protein [bacterium]|nr:tetratricopeptide repeat protein [bacterium]
MAKHNFKQRFDILTKNDNSKVLSLLEHKILDSIKHSLQDQTILFMPLNDSVYMLVIPPMFKYSDEETEQVAKEIQQGILPNKHNDEPYHILTWQQIINENLLKPASKTWQILQLGNIAANTQLVFFTNIEKTRKMVHESALQLGFNVDSQYGFQFVNIDNGEFSEQVDILKLTSQSLWQTEEIALTINTLMRSLISSFRLFYSILDNLKKMFVEASFWRENGLLHVMQNQLYGSIDYRNIAQSIRFNKTSVEEWIGKTALTDLIKIDEYPVLSIRSKVFPKARPSAMCKQENGFVIAIETISEQRLNPINIIPDSANEKRMQHYLQESVRHISKRQFRAHIYIHEYELFGAILIGDQIASISTHPGLIYGAIQSLENVPAAVRVLSDCEDTVVVVDPETSQETIQELKIKAHKILQTLYPDGSDEITLDCQITIPPFPCGEFKFFYIPLPYFELIDTANDDKIALPPGRSEYLKGIAYELIHEWELAIQAFKRAYSLDSSDGDISYALGRAMSEVNLHQESLTFLERAFAQLPDDPDVANSLGVAYLECQQKENAIRVLKHAVAMQPEEVQFLFNLGRCYFASQNLKEAEKVLTKALRYAPNFPEAHATLAQVRWLLGDLASAKKHARKAFATSPNNKYVKDLYWALTMEDDESA